MFPGIFLQRVVVRVVIARIIQVVVENRRVEQRADAVPVIHAAALGIGPLFAQQRIDGRRHAPSVVQNGRNLGLGGIPVPVAVLFRGQSVENRGPVDGRGRRHHGAFSQGITPLLHHHFDIRHPGQQDRILERRRRDAVDADKNDVPGLRPRLVGTGTAGGHYRQRDQQKSFHSKYGIFRRVLSL